MLFLILKSKKSEKWNEFLKTYPSGNVKDILKSVCIMCDLHYEHIPDGFQRLENFVSKAKEAEVDFVIELGDFCSPKEENQVLIDVLDSIGKPHYHLMGNHDSDTFIK